MKDDLSDKIKKDIERCLIEAKYVLHTEENLALCVYFFRDKCPYAEKPRKETEKYVCKYWQQRIEW